MGMSEATYYVWKTKSRRISGSNLPNAREESQEGI
jgi:hypothetical protein